MLIILTGPPATGKTTISKVLASKFPKSVHIPVDVIRHFIISGFAKASAEDEESEGQIKLAEEITYDMIERYEKKGFVVILDDVIGPDRVSNYTTRFADSFCFLLLPTLEELHKRDNNRALVDRMGARVDYLYNYFSSAKKDYYIVIDSSNQTPDESANLIFSKIAKN